MTNAPKEYAAENIKGGGEWKLEPGIWEVRGNKVVRIDDAKTALDEAADNFKVALRQLLK